jgi:hypothetical protein
MKAPGGGWKRLAGPAVIVLAAAIAVAPQLTQGNSCGHDFDFHLISWFDVLHSWQQGVFYPHWAPSANYGAGEPRFVFYPPVTWMMGAALGAMLPWAMVPTALTFLLLAATGLGTRALARQALPEGAAALAGCVAIYSGYALFTAYERTAFGELAGGFWVPLLLLFALRDRESAAPLWRRALDGSAVPLALVVAGAWLSNAPLGVMCSYLLAAVTATAAILWRSWAPVLRAAAAMTLGLGLSAFYLLPAAWEQRWVDIANATSDPGDRIENSWLFAHHAGAAMASHDSVLHKVSVIALCMIVIALAGVAVSAARGKLRGRLRWWIPLALIPVAVLVLQLPVSLTVWDGLPKLRYLQFPWRWLVVLEAPLGLFFACAVWAANRWLRVGVAVACAILVGAALQFEAHRFFQDCKTGDTAAALAAQFRAGEGFEGASEYEPLNTDNSMIAKGLPAACLSDDPTIELGTGGNDNEPPVWTANQGTCRATYGWNRSEPGHRLLKVSVAQDGYLILRLASYPAWRVQVNGEVVQALPYRADGLMAVRVLHGDVSLAVDWTATSDVVGGRWLSGLAFLLLLALSALERKKV